VPVSVALSLGGALLAILIYLAGDFGPADQGNLILVATTAFNAVAIVCLFVIFLLHRDASAAKFGKVAREHISTLAVSLMISLIFTCVSLAEIFGGGAG
jgi:hypothetical protein